MTAYQTLSDTTLQQDKPVTQGVMRALRDNPLAVAEGDVTAPKVLIKAINSQYFKAQRTANQLKNGTSVQKLQLNTKIYDPDTLFDAVTNFRFTPTVAGLYQVNVKISCSDLNGITTLYAAVAKNGTVVASRGQNQQSANNVLQPDVTTIVQMNGTTDYIEAFFYQDGLNVNYNVQGESWAVGLCES